MKKIILIAFGILAATLLLGLFVQMNGVYLDAASPQRLAEKIGLPSFAWPFIFPGFGAVITLATGLSKYNILVQKLRSDERGKESEKSDFILGMSLLFGPVLAFIMQGGISLYALGVFGKNDLMQALIALVLIFFLAMGNYIGTTKRGSPAGLRTPWSMHSDRTWFKTQRFLGRGLVVLSIAGMIMLFFYKPMNVFWVLLPFLIALKATAAGYSYFLWRREKHQHA